MSYGTASTYGAVSAPRDPSGAIRRCPRPGRIAPLLALTALIALGGPSDGEAAGTSANGPELRFPVRCDYGHDCFIQNYPDADPGPGHADHACGHLSYDGHAGTDIRPRNLAAMQRGMTVIAAADGIVRAVRDGMPDVAIDDENAPTVAGREAGNAVAIRHGDDWETQYSHLKRGSVRVEPGQRVTAGTPLGEIGLSGNTEFPHVEFIVRHQGSPLDPFTGRAPERGCGANTRGEGLWAAEAGGPPPYIATTVLSAGFAPGVPDSQKARAGAYDAASISRSAPALTFWIDIMGPQAGDRQRFRLVGPDGDRLVRHREALPRNQARRFTYVGARAPERGWPAGCYTARYALLRDGNAIARLTRRIGIGGRCPDTASAGD